MSKWYAFVLSLTSNGKKKRNLRKDTDYNKKRVQSIDSRLLSHYGQFFYLGISIQEKLAQERMVYTLQYTAIQPRCGSPGI